MEVYELHELLAESLENQEALKVVIDLVVTEYTVGAGAVNEVRAALVEMKPTELATHLIGGLTRGELKAKGVDFDSLMKHSLIASAYDDSHFILRPLPNSMFTRDSSCWIYNGVSLNPLFWPVRQLEVINVTTIYHFHPMFKDAEIEFCYPLLIHSTNLRRNILDRHH